MVDFLGIGAQKAGTTWLFANLRSHPQIWTPFVKEVHFFDRLFMPERQERTTRDRFAKLAQNPFKQIAGLTEVSPQHMACLHYLAATANGPVSRTQGWYDELFSFAPPGVVRGEITPAYCAIDEVGVRSIAERYPAIKLVYLIRDPYVRAVSSLAMAIQRRLKRSGGSDGSAADIERIATRSLADPRFLMLGDYATNIPRWDRYFGPESLIYIPFGTIRRNPNDVLLQVEAHLGVTPRGKYEMAAHQVRQSKATRLPPKILDALQELAVPQRSFLEARFGREFADSTA